MREAVEHSRERSKRRAWHLNLPGRTAEAQSHWVIRIERSIKAAQGRLSQLSIGWFGYQCGEVSHQPSS